MPDFKITKAEKTRIESVNWDNLGFGVYLSDHMYISEFKDGSWNKGEIMPYGPLPMEPSMCTIHYGQSVFEGLKAFRAADGGVNIFRPDRNAKRMAQSSERVVIPEFDEAQFIDAIKELVKVDYNWIPKTRGHSLYIRPVAFGDGNFLGVHASKTYKMIIMTSPVSSYYPEGLNPVKIFVPTDYVRAVKGGLGKAKTAGNYAASLKAGTEAKANGFAQVLWLDGVERTFVDEVGAMNIMFRIGDELITPPLNQGTILEGVTRDSVLQLAREWGMHVSERLITIDEILDAHRSGELKEAFGTGTAAVISPVGQLTYKGEDFIINDMKIGSYAQKFYDEITAIQYGEKADEHGWIVKVEI